MECTITGLNIPEGSVAVGETSSWPSYFGYLYIENGEVYLHHPYRTGVNTVEFRNTKIEVIGEVNGVITQMIAQPQLFGYLYQMTAVTSENELWNMVLDFNEKTKTFPS